MAYPSADNGGIQRVAIVAPPEGFSASSVAVTGAGTQVVVEVSATPTLDTAAYTSGDSLHTAVLEFTSAVGASGGSGFIEKMVVVDKDKQEQALELWLFSATVTPAAANAAHSISDAHAALCQGVISSGPYLASALNSISTAKAVSLAFKCAATSLFGILVTRGTPTYTTSGLVVSLLISQN